MRALSLEEVAALTKPKVRVVPRKLSPSNPNLGTSCDHQWQPAKTIITSPGLKEFPTKKCTLCDLWICLQPDEIQEEVITDMGDWLA
jgi:hypothetical protein